jgi:hypothetical protein
MAGKGQERFEDFLAVERFIEELQAGRVAHPPAALTPDLARIYRMAMSLHVSWSNTRAGVAACKIAVSAACAHLGCLVHWHRSDHAFHCPCHEGIFMEEGDTHPRLLSLPPPRSQAKGAQGKVCVHVPLSQHEALCSLTEVAEAPVASALLE